MFVKGFEKTSSLGDPNDMKLGDDFNTGNVGAGGMAPSGIPRYQPVSKNDMGGEKKKGKRTLSEVADLIYKYSSGMEDAALSSGSISQDGTDAINQPKNASGPTQEQEVDDRKAQKSRRKAYVRASLK